LLVKFAGAAMRDAQGARIAAAREPAQREEARTENRTEGAGDVRAALGLIEAFQREAAAGEADGGGVDAEIREPLLAARAEVVFAVTERADHLFGFQRSREIDGDAAGNVVVAGARGPHGVRIGRMERDGAARARGNGAECFEGAGDFGAGEIVIAMASTGLDGEQAAVNQFGKMGARRLRRNAGCEREFASRQSAAVEKSDEDRGARGLAD
jgi:hypothetical protein